MRPDDLRSRQRLVDANLNRAAEALRVAEDICRFSWDLKGAASQLKALRHEVLGALSGEGCRREELLVARDVTGDVGRETASPPRARTDLADVAFRNLQRAKEALRSLEEVSLADQPGASAALGKARYRLYAIEKSIGHRLEPEPAGSRLARVSLYLLATSSLTHRPLEQVVAEALEAGVDMVQLREKELPDRDLLELARRLREVTARAGAPLVINDRPDIAELSGADGVHVGQGDLSVAAVRSLLGRERIVGVSTHSLAQALAAEQEGADYIGVGPVFPTATKDAGPALGTDRLKEALEQVTIPAFAIGGISADSAPAVVAAGGRRIAVSSTLLQAQDTAGAVVALRAVLDRLTVEHEAPPPRGG